jgi:hypothetical protein
MNTKSYLHLEGDVRVVVMEWLPIGLHAMKFLQDKLECSKGFHDFFVTSRIDHERNAATVDLAEREVLLRIDRYSPLEDLQFSAKVQFDDTGGKSQDESIGIDISRDGKISYGLQLVATNDEPYSMDQVAHIVADLIEDSSRVMNTILNAYQKRLLDTLYCEQSSQRDKFVILMANRLRPGVTEPHELCTNAAYKSEVRQVLGDPYMDQYCKADDGSMFIVGENGILVVSEDPDKYREVLRLYGLMGCIVDLQNNAFNRLSWAWDQLYAQKRLVETEDIESVVGIQTTLSNLSADRGMLSSVPEYQSRTVKDVSARLDALEGSHPELVKSLPFFRCMKRIFDCCEERIAEAQRAVEALGNEIDNVRLLASTLAEKHTAGINRAMNILTVVSVIVLPLTLITGIYGMNFYRYRPAGEHISAWNMPELYLEYGYPIVIGAMIVIAGGLFALFRRQGLMGRAARKNNCGPRLRARR